MGFFKKLFGETDDDGSAEPVVKQLHTRSAKEVRGDNSFVSVYAAGGREVFLDRNQWRTNILPANIEQYKDDADELCQIILTAMRDGFFEDILQGVRRLHCIDPLPSRSGALLAITFIETGAFREAITVIDEVIANGVNTGPLLTLKARAYSHMGDRTKALEILEESLATDPNQANAVEWRGAIALEDAGEAGYEACMARLAESDTAWRPLFWLGRLALQRENVKEALGFFADMAQRKNPLPADVAMAVSGDLGKAGCYEEVISMFGTPFHTEVWGLLTGSNVIGACIALNRAGEAQAYLDQLKSMKQPQWTEHVQYLQGEIEKSKKR